MQKPKIWLWVLGGSCALLFVAWTILVKCVDWRVLTADGGAVGLGAFNGWWWRLTGTNAAWRWVSEIIGGLSLLAVGGLLIWQVVAFCRQGRRGITWRFVAADIILLGVLSLYLTFEIVPVNYRPLLAAGKWKASYPSSHVLLIVVAGVLTVAQVWALLPRAAGKIGLASAVSLVVLLGVWARACCGLHWLSDILGGLLAAGALVFAYFALTFRRKMG